MAAPALAAALLIAHGEHVKVIADRLGHANPIVTMTTYARLFDGLDVAAAERLDETWADSVTDPDGLEPDSDDPLDAQKPPSTRGFVWWALLGLNQ